MLVLTDQRQLKSAAFAESLTLIYLSSNTGLKVGAVIQKRQERNAVYMTIGVEARAGQDCCKFGENRFAPSWEACMHVRSFRLIFPFRLHVSTGVAKVRYT